MLPTIIFTKNEFLTNTKIHMNIAASHVVFLGRLGAGYLILHCFRFTPI